jgi:hypothetical protein
MHFLAMNSENEKSVRQLDNIRIYESLSKFDSYKRTGLVILQQAQ